MTAILVLSGIHDASAFMAAAPPPSIQFERGTDRLTRDGEIQVDRLAVLAARCGPGVLTLRVLTAKGVVAAPRAVAIQRRLRRLGLLVQTGEWAFDRDDEKPRPRQPAVVIAEVGSVDGRCEDYGEGYASAGSALYGWIDALARHLHQPSTPLPDFWQRISVEARRDSLSLPMASTALCEWSDDCVRHSDVAIWLARWATAGTTSAGRRKWLVRLWPLADDAEAEDLSTVLRLKPLTAEQKGLVAEVLVGSKLPWETIERRLLEPGVMQAFAVAPPQGDVGPANRALISAAVRRDQVSSMGRLVAAAGAAKACFIDTAIYFSMANAEMHGAMSAQFVEWAKVGAIPPWEPRRAFRPQPCDPTGTLLWAAYCDEDAENRGRGQRTWRSMLAAGFKPHRPTIERLIAHGAPEHAPQWKLQPVDNEANEFTCVAVNRPATISP
ncbi:hypothetical protein ACG04R_09120 [Roseateles sp. BYS78W]|uniref:Uncharacterized protein n=1 Tax=Pelomonas candidula TaxID=3299025 RepID=A0ABW7HA86_9BURK